MKEFVEAKSFQEVASKIKRNVSSISRKKKRTRKAEKAIKI